MLNKILIEMILKQLLKDVFRLTFIITTYNIENKKGYYEITINATLSRRILTISKSRKIRIENWVELITGYTHIKDMLQKELVENIKEEQC